MRFSLVFPVRAALFALLPVLAVACAAPEESTASTDEAIVAGNPGDAVDPSRIAGNYHLAGTVEPTNLTIEPDGTFVWNTYGCDYEGAACGTWSKSSYEGAIQLTASGGGTFHWIDDTSFMAKATKLIVSKTDATHLRISGFVDGKLVIQSWEAGVACGSCFGGAPVCVEATKEWCQ